MNASSVNWKKNRMITLHKNNILPFFIFLRNFGLGNFSGNFGKFRGNSGPKNPSENGSYIIPFLYFESY